MSKVKKVMTEIKPVLNTIKFEPMGDDEIKIFLPDAKIIKYSELRKLHSLDDLLPNDKDYAIILVENNFNRGHWIVIMKDGNLINYFDSYGRPIDAHLFDVPIQKRVQLQAEKPYLTNLLKQEVSKGKKVIFNKTAFQGGGDGLATCGRHSIYRILNFLNGMGEDKYMKMMKRIKDKTGLTYDQIVSFTIPEKL